MPSVERIKKDPEMLATAVTLTEIFQESTGRALMDSGDFYGRNWEENQKLDGWEAFAARPEASMVTSEGEIDYFILDGWHYVVERFTFSQEWQNEFNEFSEGSKESHLEDMREFAAKITEIEEESGRYGSWSTWNTYNDATYLNETFFVVTIPDVGPQGEDLFLLSYHGGCDVRGGYTSPVALLGRDGHWNDVQDVEVECSCNEDVEFRVSPGDIYSWNRATDEQEYLERFDKCPNCGTVDGLSVRPAEFDSGSY